MSSVSPFLYLITTTLNKRSMMTFPQNIEGGTFAQIKTLGTLFELDFQPRNTDMNDGTGFDLFGSGGDLVYGESSLTGSSRC